MVLSRNDKRKRKEGDLVDLMDPLSEAPKRTKVHAQRKFAQGAATPVFTTPTQTPVKEKEKQQPNVRPAVIKELITHKRPNTEDFLTFLCFRGTSILPPSLNFFNTNNRSPKGETKHHRNLSKSLGREQPSNKNRTSSPNSNSNSNSTETQTQKNALQQSKSESQRNIASKGKSSQPTSTISIMKKKLSSSSFQKYKSSSSTKSTSNAVHALKKKYQEQRLAKQRIKQTSSTATRVVSVIRTRSSTILSKLPGKMVPLPVKRDGLRSGVQRKIGSHLNNSKLSPSRSRKRARKSSSEKSSSSEEEEEEEDEEEDEDDEEEDEEEEEEEEEDEDEDEDDEEEEEEKQQQQKRKVPLQKSLKKKKLKPTQKKICTVERRVTRSRAVLVDERVSKRPSRKTKEAAALYMEILGRKLVSPDLENDDILGYSFPELPKRVSERESERKKGAEENEKRKAEQKRLKESEEMERRSKSKSNEEPEKKKAKSNDETEKKKVDEKKSKVEDKNKKKDSEESEKKKLKDSEKAKDKKFIEAESERLQKSRETLDSEKKLSRSKKASKPEKRVREKRMVVKKSQRLKTIQKYCESDDTEEDFSSSASSYEQPKNVSSQALKSQRSLRSNSKFEKNEVEKKPVVLKKEEKGGRAEPAKKVLRSKKVPKSGSDSEEESLGTLLKRIKKKDSYEQSSKTSDEEESFRGFSRKAISKVLTHIEVPLEVEMDKKRIGSTEGKKTIVEGKKVDGCKSSEMKKNTGEGKKATVESKKQNLENKKTAAGTDGKKVALVESKKFPETKKSSEPPKREAKKVPETKKNYIETKSKKLTTLEIEKSLETSGSEETKKSFEPSKEPSEDFKTINDLEIVEKVTDGEEEEEEEEEEEQEKRDFGEDKTFNMQKAENLQPENLKSLEELKILERTEILEKILDQVEAKRLFEEKKCVHEKNLNLIDIPSTHLGRKEKVNMSTEQIEKWLNESSLAKEESKIEMENTNYLEEKANKDCSHLSISTKIQHLVRPVNVTLSKLDKSKDRFVVPKKTIVKAEKKATPTTTVAVSVEKIEAVIEKKMPSKKLFSPKSKERKNSVPNVNAFSAENESSVYAFESDSEEVNTPFRRKRLESSQMEEEKKKCGENSANSNSNSTSLIELLPKNFANLANVQVLPLDKLTTNWSNVNCSASIAVQVNLDNQEQVTPEEQKGTEISTQTDTNMETDEENNDNGGQLFYIPLQSVTRNGAMAQGQQLIQGVAVKLGTEGPTGPNQRVLLRAKLVTKPPVTVARCPPIGTVQPTTRPPQPLVTTPKEDEPVSIPSTSSNTPRNLNVGSTTSTTSTTIASTSTKELFTQPILNKAFVGNLQHFSARQSSTSSVCSEEKVTKSPKASRERKTSIDSSKSGKRSSVKSKTKSSTDHNYSPSNNLTSFPSADCKIDEACLVEAPTFHPTEKDFQDPLEYIDKIRPVAEKFGICRVVPPANFKPECKVSDDMRFTAYNQYVHRMLHRWGPNVKEVMAIKKYLATQSITLTHPPWIGGMEVDLPHLYQTVQSLGGLKEVIEKKKWQKVADGMKIPKSAQDRVTKLDDIYCKYLLPYDTLSPEEREKLFDEVEAEWRRKETKALERQNAPSSSNDNEDDEEEDSSDEIEECIVKGRNMPLNAFYRIARNTQRMWFGENQCSGGNETDGASASEVEAAFWKHVAERKRHVCVHAASIDSGGRGFGFSIAKNSPFARHPWNLKVLTNNTGSVLRALGPLMGVTVPTLHVGMLFSACCWYRDPHGLPWIEYLHTGAKKIWYGIPDEHNNNFRDALSKMVPRYCKNKTIWLPSDTAMVPPEMLVSNGVPLCHTVQEPGQFIVVFPKAFTSSICTGYVVSESVYFAQSTWLETAEQVFKDIQDSCEPSIFSFEKLLFNIINDSRSHIEVLKQILPSVLKIRERELDYRKQLENIGLTNTEKLPLPDNGRGKKGRKVKEDDGDYECETCRANLFVSLVSNSQDESVYCLPHALQLLIRKNHLLKSCTLMYTYSEDELDDLIHKLEDRIEAKSKKTNQTNRQIR